MNCPGPKKTDTITFNDHRESPVAKFRELLLSLASLGVSEDVTLTAFEDESLPHFQKLSPEDQIELTHRLATYCDVMTEVLKEDKHIINNPNSLWRMLKRLGLRTSDDLFSHLTNEDVIEIYDTHGRQLYRSFNFFKLCNYSLEQIYAVPWFDLYERNDELTQANFDFVTEILQKPELGTRMTPIPIHDVRERRFPYRRITLIQPRFMSPMFDSKRNVIGFINTFRSLESINVPSPSNN